MVYLEKLPTTLPTTCPPLYQSSHTPYFSPPTVSNYASPSWLVYIYIYMYIYIKIGGSHGWWGGPIQIFTGVRRRSTHLEEDRGRADSDQQIDRIAAKREFTGGLRRLPRVSEFAKIDKTP